MSTNWLLEHDRRFLCPSLRHSPIQLLSRLQIPAQESLINEAIEFSAPTRVSRAESRTSSNPSWVRTKALEIDRWLIHKLADEEAFVNGSGRRLPGHPMRRV
jgi:hypothetical protein